MKDTKRYLAIYEKVVTTYPNAYKQQYAEQMKQTLHDMLADEPSATKARWLFARTLIETPMCAGYQQFNELGLTMTKMPHYIKRNSTIAGLFLFPFILSILANYLSVLVVKHTLYQSWVWNKPILITWVLLLPALAFTLSAVTLVKYVLLDPDGKELVMRRVLNIRQN